MKIDAIAQSPMEWLAIKANLMPRPLGHTQIMFVISRAVLCAHKFEIFEVMKDGDATLECIAAKTTLDARALRSLMNVLLSAGYFHYVNGMFSLTEVSRKWCLKDSPYSVHDQQLFNIICWDWMTYMDEFLQTGKGLQFHEMFNEKEWGLYQRGMENVAAGTAKSAVKMAPKLNEPTRMLDIGGAHGIYSVEFCKRYLTLSATILDLPQAVQKAWPILAKYGMGARVHHREGNALKDDLGTNEYDIILVSSLIHHFTKEQVMQLSGKIARALKPGGYYIIQEFVRPETSAKMDMIGTSLDLFFNLSSTAGNWSLAEIKAFQDTAGMRQLKVKRFMTTPGYVQATAVKS